MLSKNWPNLDSILVQKSIVLSILINIAERILGTCSSIKIRGS